MILQIEIHQNQRVFWIVGTIFSLIQGPNRGNFDRIKLYKSNGFGETLMEKTKWVVNEKH